MYWALQTVCNLYVVRRPGKKLYGPMLHICHPNSTLFTARKSKENERIKLKYFRKLKIQHDIIILSNILVCRKQYHREISPARRVLFAVMLCGRKKPVKSPSTTRIGSIDSEHDLDKGLCPFVCFIYISSNRGQTDGGHTNLASQMCSSVETRLHTYLVPRCDGHWLCCAVAFDSSAPVRYCTFGWRGWCAQPSVCLLVLVKRHQG